MIEGIRVPGDAGRYEASDAPPPGAITFEAIAFLLGFFLLLFLIVGALHAFLHRNDEDKRSK